MKWNDIGFFDHKSEFANIERQLPHWAQAGTLCFITWRLDDSLPAHVLDRMDDEISALLRSLGVDSEYGRSRALQQLNPAVRTQLHRRLFAVRDKYLDSGYGACWLRQHDSAKVVLDSLLYFDGVRYFLTDAVVMPNHVHFLVAFPTEEAMLRQCANWKRFTARRINSLVGRTGPFWQRDQYDHLVRGPDEFAYYRRYIFSNPSKANLRVGDYLYYHKEV